jgi:hypothetical protein
MVTRVNNQIWWSNKFKFVEIVPMMMFSLINTGSVQFRIKLERKTFNRNKIFVSFVIYFATLSYLTLYGAEWWNDCQMMDWKELKRNRWGPNWSIILVRIYLEGSRKITKHLSEHRRCLGYEQLQNVRVGRYWQCPPTGPCSLMESTDVQCTVHYSWRTGTMTRTNSELGCHCLFIIVNKRVVSLNKLNNEYTRGCNQNSGLLLTRAFITAVTYTETQ